jgi:chromosome segregation ATPase
LATELTNAKHVLGEKCLGAHKTREESNARAVDVDNNRNQLTCLQNELEGVKADRLNMGREIAKLNDMVAARTADGARMVNHLTGVNNDVAATTARVQDLEKIIAMKSNDLTAKQQALVQCQCELQRTRDSNAAFQADVNGLIAANDRQAHENCELAKELQSLEARNTDLVCNVGKAEERLRGLDAQLHCTRADNECAKKVNCELQNCLKDKMAEKCALENHVACLTTQNSELSKELSLFVTQDEQLRAQLDRRARVEVLEKKNANELATSNVRVAEARSRSPMRPVTVPVHAPVPVPMPMMAPRMAPVVYTDHSPVRTSVPIYTGSPVRYMPYPLARSPVRYV